MRLSGTSRGTLLALPISVLLLLISLAVACAMSRLLNRVGVGFMLAPQASRETKAAAPKAVDPPAGAKANATAVPHEHPKASKHGLSTVVAPPEELAQVNVAGPIDLGDLSDLARVGVNLRIALDTLRLRDKFAAAAGRNGLKNGRPRAIWMDHAPKNLVITAGTGEFTLSVRQ